MAPRNSHSFIFLAACGLLALAGCHHNPPIRDDVHFFDDDAPAYTGSFISRPAEMKHGRGQGGIEFTYERYRGEAEQEIDANHFVRVDNVTLNGPQTVTHTVDVKHGHIGYNHLFNFGSHFELEPMLGVAYDKMVATTRAEAPSTLVAKDDQHNWGLALRVSPRWMFNRYIGIEGRFGGAVDGDSEWAGNTRGALVLRPSPNLEIKAGYYSHEQEFDLREGTSDIEAEFEGFTAHVSFIF